LLSKSGNRYQELAIDQEIAFILKQQFNVASDLQRTLLRLGKSFYAESATSFLCSNREDLFVPTVLQFAHQIASPRIPQDLLDV
jgi:hypothetical protein